MGPASARLSITRRPDADEPPEQPCEVVGARVTDPLGQLRRREAGLSLQNSDGTLHAPLIDELERRRAAGPAEGAVKVTGGIAAQAREVRNPDGVIERASRPGY